VLGFSAGLRIMMPFGSLSNFLANQGPDIADGGPAIDVLSSNQTARALSIAALGEVLIDKTPFPPTRVLPIPLALRVVAGGTVCALSNLAEGRTSDSGALIGSLSAIAGSLFGYTFRTRLPLPGWLLAIAEDGLAFALSRWAVQH
jgi:uncharacterized membrane protein